MTKSFTLDVLVPHFRDPAGLKRSLNSIAGQTWRGRMRVLVVDDGSDDATFKRVQDICEGFAASTPFAILLVRNSENQGRPRTRNRLLDLSDADYLAWLDAGDIWYPDKIRAQFDKLDELAAEGRDISNIWVSCSYDWEQSGRSRPLKQKVDGDQVRELLAGEGLRAYLWTLLGSAEAFRIAGRFDERLPRLQDLDYFVRFARAGGKIVTTRKAAPLCRYFKSDIGRNAAEIHACYRLILAKNRSVLDRYPASFRSMLGYKGNRLAARFALSNGNRKAAIGYLTRAALEAPRHTLHVVRNVIGKRFRTEG